MKYKMNDGLKTFLIVTLSVVMIFGGAFGIYQGAIKMAEVRKANAPKPHQEVYTEGDLKITCDYSASDTLLFKNVYNTKSKVTTTYTYIYESNGWGTNLAEVQIVTIDEKGQIIDQINSK